MGSWRWIAIFSGVADDFASATPISDWLTTTTYTDAPGDPDPIGSVLQVTTYDDATTSPGDVFVYAVIAIAPDPTLSVVSSFDGGFRKLSPPVVRLDQSVPNTIQWTGVDGGTAYQVYRTERYRDSIQVTVVLPWSISGRFTDKSAMPGKFYFYYVKAATNVFGDNPSFYSEGISSDPNFTTGLPSEMIKLATYPNPTNGVVFFQSPGQIDDLTVFDTSGRSIKCSVKNNSVDFTALPAGIYMLYGKGSDKLFSAKVVRSAD